MTKIAHGQWWRRPNASQRGQSLIEVTFATAVVSIVLVGILSTVIQSVQNSRVALEQSRATQYAQEVLEWFRHERDSLGWSVFYSAFAGLGATQEYCVVQLPLAVTDIAGLPAGECDPEQVITATNYRRSVLIEVVSNNQIKVTAQVTRPGRGTEVTTALSTLLTNWE